ncbi:polysaccharide biosynthesis tyrosine autokinase [Bradyrhizobium sp. Pa8]|uniref:polysaccharide biosynthesis tyrosine autokinase n=1 Tax=Bradyrhizobium sp. Pa8 TaxID=3386552 RepID=UPI00403F75AE
MAQHVDHPKVPMLYSEKSRVDFELPRPPESAAEGLNRFVGFLQRQYLIILITALSILALGLVYVATAPPRFTAQTTLIIDTRKVQLFQQQSILGDIPIDSASVESQIEILKSEKVALSVIKTLHLIEDPEFSGSRSGLFSSAFGLVSAVLGSRDTASDFELTRSAIRTFQSQLNIKRIGLSYVIEISFKSLSRNRASEIANAVAEAYIVDQLEAKDQATRRASAWLQDRIGELRNQATLAERAVVDFKAKNNIVNTGGSGGRLVTEQQVSELNSQVVVARAQTSEAKARLDRIEAVLRADSPSSTVNSTVADALKSEVVTKLRSQYLDIANREADWARRYGTSHQAAINLRSQMAEIQNSILNELQRLAETYKSDYEIAKQREAGVQRELENAVDQSKTTNQAQVSLKELESASQTYRTLYDNFLQRYMESIQQQSFPISEARVISQATPPTQKSDPKPALALGLSGLGGLILGLGLAILRDLSDRVFRTAEHVEAELNAACISLVPKIGNGKTPRDTLDNRVATSNTGHRTITRSRGLIWTASNDPFSQFSEAVRAIKLAIDLSWDKKSSRVIGITSAIPNEGKSTLSASLAQLIAQTGARVLLVDCDLRNSALSNRLAPAAEFGIIDGIMGQKQLSELLWRDSTTNMSFLPGAVGSESAMHPNELLRSSAASQFFDVLREHYDYVVVDLSPLAPVVDVRATTQLMDAYILAIRWAHTKFDVVAQALKSAPAVQDNMLGVVLTQADAKSLQVYTGYGNVYYGERPNSSFFNAR